MRVQYKGKAWRPWRKAWTRKNFSGNFWSLEILQANERPEWLSDLFQEVGHLSEYGGTNRDSREVSLVKTVREKVRVIFLSMFSKICSQLPVTCVSERPAF